MLCLICLVCKAFILEVSITWKLFVFLLTCPCFSNILMLSKHSVLYKMRETQKGWSLTACSRSNRNIPLIYGVHRENIQYQTKTNSRAVRMRGSLWWWSSLSSEFTSDSGFSLGSWDPAVGSGSCRCGWISIFTDKQCEDYLWSRSWPW